MNWFENLFENKPKRIFLDYASATPVRPEVRKEMEQYWSEDFYNPNAIYEEGLKVRNKVEECRTKIARIAGVPKDSVIWTSGGTHSNALVVRGVKPGKIIVEPESHPSVTEAAESISSGKEVTLVSSVAANNNLGRQIREERKNKNSVHPLLHIDASQTANYFDINLETLACDILTLDSAKLYGPKGIGAIILRRGVKLNLPPLGTPPVPLIAGFAKALELAVRDRESERIRLSSLSTRFAERVQAGVPQAVLEIVEPNMVHVSIPGILPEFLVLALDRRGVKASAGPACNAHKPEPPETPVRFSFGHETSEKDIKKAAEIFCRTVQNMVK